ncbi:hypothetical protein GW17_00013459 [Ensete ventricosum]|nr:hypothetical protein GW17_00013459 [Ensete ventricosum]
MRVHPQRLHTKDNGSLQTEVPTNAYKTHSYLQAKIGHKANQTRAAKPTASPLLAVQEVLKKVVERGEEATMSTEGLSYPNAKRCSKKRWTRRSATVSQRRIYRLRRNGRRCKATDSRAMGLTTPWFRRGKTSVESSIPCSYGGRVLVVKGGREGGEYRVKLKYQDKAKGRGQGTS